MFNNYPKVKGASSTMSYDSRKEQGQSNASVSWKCAAKKVRAFIYPQRTKTAPRRAPAEATIAPKKPSEAKGARPAAALVWVAVLVLEVLVDVLEGDVVDALEAVAVPVAVAVALPLPVMDAHSSCSRACAAWISAVVQFAVKHVAASDWKVLDVQTQFKSVKLEQPALEAAVVTQLRRHALNEGVEAAAEAVVVWAWTASTEAATTTARDFANMTTGIFFSAHRSVVG